MDIVPLSAVAGATEPAWHRNSRAKRSRARDTLRAAKHCQVCPVRYAVAERLLRRHHGTRGGTPADMVLFSKHDVWDRTGRNGKPVPIPHPDSWRCDKCSDQCRKEGDNMPWFVRPKLTCCPKCSGNKPKRFTTFENSKVGKATAASVAAAKKNGDGGGGAAGGGGGTSNAGKQLQKRIDELEKQNKQLRDQRDAADDVEEEDVEAADEDMSTNHGTVEQWEEQLKLVERDLKVAERNAKESPKVARYSQQIEELKASRAEFQKWIQESKDPHEQIEKKTERAKQLRRWQQQLLEKIKAEREAEEEAEMQAQVHADTAKKHHDRWSENEAELKQIELDTRQLLAPPPKEPGAEVVGELLQKTFSVHMQELEEDPLFKGNANMEACKKQLQTMQAQVTAAMAQMLEFTKTMQGQMAEARRVAQAAKPPASESSGAAAVPAASPPIAKQPPPPPRRAKSAPRAGARSASPAGHRTTAEEGKSRSPRGRKRGVPSETAEEAKPQPQPAKLDSELADKIKAARKKKVRDRTDEETLLLASVGGKAAKKQEDAEI